MRSTNESAAPRPFFEAPGSASAGRRLLLLSYHFPPAATAGSLRWQKLAGFAAERGWTLDVVTRDPAQLDRPDEARLKDLPAGTRVFGVAEGPSLADHAERWLAALHQGLQTLPTRLRRSAPTTGAARSSASAVAKSLSRDEILRGRRSLMRDYHAWRSQGVELRWAVAAAQFGARLIQGKRPDAVVTCGPPHMIHEAGRRLAARSAIPLVVDMRDPWSLVQRLPRDMASPVWLERAARFEGRMAAAASLIVANTPPAAEGLRTLYPEARDRVIAVMNGYDEEVLPAVKRSRRFTVAYAGTIYLDRDPRALMRAAARLVREQGLSAEEFGIDLMGRVEAHDGVSIQELAQAEGLRDYVRAYPPGSREQALQFLAKATMLVSLPQDSDMAIPSKIFEYLQFPAWLLAFAEPGSATAQALRDTPSDVVSAQDTDAIVRVLRGRYRQHVAHEWPAPAPPGGPLSRGAQAKRLFDALEHKIAASASGSHSSEVGIYDSVVH